MYSIYRYTYIGCILSTSHVSQCEVYRPMSPADNFADVAPRKLGSSYAATGSASLPVLFHGQQQHVGVSLDGKIDQVYVRAAVNVVLKACLSPEDGEVEAEPYLIREMIVKRCA
jgi:hypothetical protein